MTQIINVKYLFSLKEMQRNCCVIEFYSLSLQCELQMCVQTLEPLSHETKGTESVTNIINLKHYDYENFI